MKNRIVKNGNIDTITLSDLINRHQLNDLETMLIINQGLTEAILLLTRECDAETCFAVSAIARAASILQDINRINWDEYDGKN